MRSRLRRRIVTLVAVGTLAGLLSVRWASADWSQPVNRLAALLDREVHLTQSAADVQRSLVLLDRERASLDYTREVLRHAGSESMRRLDSYRRDRATRERHARARGRALYKLSRGRLARLAFEDLTEDDAATEQRVQQGRLMRFVIRHDLQELALRKRAESRAEAELLAASRELQALSALTMIQAMQEHALVASEVAVDPELRKTQWQRRNLVERSDHTTLRANRKFLRLVHERWQELASLRGLDGVQELRRPVAGPTVGRFGVYEDPVLRLPMVRNGLELRARKNETVHALAEGRVIMVSELPGYDQVVVLDHGAGQYSLTARLWQLVVTEGEQVQAGQPLGRAAPKTIDDGLGRTIYLELRHGEKPIDPTPYLKHAR